MKLNLKKLLLLSALLPTATWAQNVDRSKYPDYSDKVNPDPSLMRPRKMRGKAASVTGLPDYVNNAETRYFPPVLNQDGGSCGSASRICYMFSHELNSFRNLDGKDAHNYYPSHFVWLLTYGNSGKDQFVQYVGVPSAATYGGQTTSKLFGYQEASQNDFGWMTGYDKWYEAMFNRMLKPAHFSENLGTEAGREALKRWLYNHNGDSDFSSGGIAGIGCASSGIQMKAIETTPANTAAGVVGKHYLSAWGTTVDHAMTIVGYDDRIEFDLNGNGKYGESESDERGAWIMVNSWGDDWADGGFIYCPYAYAGATFNADGKFTGNWWTPEVYKVRKNYRPLRTIKVEMDYSRRSELCLSGGVAKDLNATQPEYSVPFHHFQYAGDGNNGNTNPAPEIPMLGRWIDNTLHTEPMEFGYDLTDLSDNLDPNEPLKYFFIIDTKSWAKGTGHVYKASILDYAQDSKGLEIPFDTGDKGVTVENQGNRTVLTVVVPGRGYRAPLNVAVNGNTLTWSKPAASKNVLTGFRVYKGTDELLATLDAGTTQYALPDGAAGSYAVQAVYGSKQSVSVSATVPAKSTSNKCLKTDHTGFTIPGVFGSKYDKATIEYWIRPMSLSNWNQSAGPGWGQFMFHANANGNFTAGWGLGSDRMELSSVLKLNQWTHIAMVVDGNTLTTYVNGVKKGSITSANYSGIGGFGDLAFSGSGTNSDQHAYYDEIRIWNKARTAAEISADYKLMYTDGILPENLIAYYPGDTFEVGGETLLRDHTTGQRHASFANSNFSVNSGWAQSLGYTTKTEVSIVQPDTKVMVGQPVTLRAKGSTNIVKMEWTATGTDGGTTVASTLTTTFKQAGKQEVKVVATDVKGKTQENTLSIDVAEAPKADAAFKMTKQQVTAGERVTFMPVQVYDGTTYKWTLDGASTRTSDQPYVTVSYDATGTYDVTLEVTDANGQKATSTQQIGVKGVAPKVSFDVSPAIVMKGDDVTLTNHSLYNPQHGQWTLVSAQTAMQCEGLDVSFRPEVPGIYDVTFKATNDVGSGEVTMNRALVVCNADSKTGLSFMPEGSAKVELSKVPLTKGQGYFTIDWWMRPNSLRAACNGIGESKSTFELMTTATGKMCLYIGGKCAQSSDGFVIANEWHHYAVTYSSPGIVCFFRDGEKQDYSSVIQQIPELSTFSLGTNDAPMMGTVDEFRVWNFAFNENKPEKLQGYISKPLDEAGVAAAQNEGLQVYYKFDQSSGNVTDATSNANTGVRKGFGPDGDAWTSSKGVFALCFDNKAEDVTEKYLANYKAPFANTGEVFNDVYGFWYGSRFMTLSDWKLDNVAYDEYGKDTKSNTGAAADNMIANYLVISTGQDGFVPVLTDHKVYQTVELPKGAYVFSANYPGDKAVQPDGCYVVAAEGDSLPGTNYLTEALASRALGEKSASLQNSVFFVLTEPAKVSLGLLASMTGKQALYIKSFALKCYDITPMNGVINGCNGIKLGGVVPETPADINAAGNVYDLSGRRVMVPGKGIYIIGGKKVVR